MFSRTKNQINNEEKELAWEYCGGKPVCLVETINSENREKKIKEMLEIRKGQIKDLHLFEASLQFIDAFRR